jgi:hypothetical protein
MVKSWIGQFWLSRSSTSLGISRTVFCFISGVIIYDIPARLTFTVQSDEFSSLSDEMKMQDPNAFLFRMQPSTGIFLASIPTMIYMLSKIFLMNRWSDAEIPIAIL